MIAGYGLELEEDIAARPVWILADPVRLTQIIDNLIGNALKFTPAPGRISLSLRQEGAEAVLRVRDTGIGIRQEKLAQIFEPFHQENQDIARGSGGLGLGLPLTKGLVELHNGRIEARSDGPGLGAEFIVRLPLAPAGEITQSVNRGEVAPRKVLLVEDNADAAQMLHELLQLLGHEVIVTETATAALGRLQWERPDVVLCDIGLPGMNGHDFARAVRADETLRDLTLVAITGYGQPADRERTAEAGFDSHLTKPVSITALEEIFSGLAG